MPIIRGQMFQEIVLHISDFLTSNLSLSPSLSLSPFLSPPAADPSPTPSLRFSVCLLFSAVPVSSLLSTVLS